MSEVLKVEGAEVPVERAEDAFRPLGDHRRAFSGRGRSSTSAERPHVRSWSFRTAVLAAPEIDDLVDDLTAPGTVTAEGSVVGASPVECHATNIRREWGPLLGAHDARLSFELHAEEPES